MSSEVDICNLALALLGDAATVTSINPPDQSAQAGHCNRFYPIARDALLEMHTWGFATTRVQLAYAATNPSTTWKYAYETPSAVVNFISVLAATAADDSSAGIQMAGTVPGSIQNGLGVYTPQPFVVESDLDGNDVILTNVENALLRYTTVVTDTTRFSPLFVEALSILLAAKLAGPLIKGSEGRAAAKDMMTTFFRWWNERAVESDSNQRRTTPLPSPSWMVNR